MVTSSHATQYNLEMPFGRGLIVSYGNQFHVLRKDQLRGFARFLGGALFKGDEKDVIDFCDSLNAPVLGDRGGRPAVWLGAGNCLLGDARKSRNSMVVTALSAGGFNQLVGYVVPTWYGRGGWGTLKVFTTQGDRLSLAEAFFLNNQDLLAETQRRFPKSLGVEFNDDDVETWMKKPDAVEPLAEAGYLAKDTAKDALGLVHDRDVVAFYGDPAWRAGFAKPATPAYQLEFGKAAEDGLHVTVTNSGKDTWKGDVFSMLPKRIPAAKCKEDAEKVTVADNFILIRAVELKPGDRRTVVIYGIKS
jgi:zinc protease